MHFKVLIIFAEHPQDMYENKKSCSFVRSFLFCYIPLFEITTSISDMQRFFLPFRKKPVRKEITLEKTFKTWKKSTKKNIFLVPYCILCCCCMVHKYYLEWSQTLPAYSAQIKYPILPAPVVRKYKLTVGEVHMVMGLFLYRFFFFCF